MRTEFKIGIAVGLFVAIVAVAYFVFSGDGEPGAAQDQGQRPRIDLTKDDGYNRLDDLAKQEIQPPPERETDTSGKSDVTPAVAPGGDGGQPATEPIANETGRDERLIPELTPLVTEQLPVIARAPDETGKEIFPVISPAGPPIEPTAAGGAEQTYVVVKGDAGFWAIAEKTYGDGRHWDLIARANPNADSNALRPGQKLKIPPKPKAPAVATLSPAEAGSIIESGGQKLYVVKAGDAGLWDIAEALYGKGKHWPLIAKANPNASSSALRPGTKLVIPPLSESRAPAPRAPSTDARGSLRTDASGRKIYIVKDGDAGFWAVSQAAYGEGKHWLLIARANPNAISSALRPGQKLLVPPLTDEGRTAPPPG